MFARHFTGECDAAPATVQCCEKPCRAGFRDAIDTYLNGIAQGLQPTPTLDDAAAVLAKAANKALTPDIMAAINARLAAENPDNLSLSNFANPTNDPTVASANEQLATDLSVQANTLQQS